MSLMASATSAAGRASLGFVLLFRWLAFPCLVFSKRLGATLEIRRIPAAAVKLEAGSRKLLGKSILAAFRAGIQWRIANLAQDFLVATTFAATVFVDRQGRISLKIKIIPESWVSF